MANLKTPSERRTTGQRKRLGRLSGAVITTAAFLASLVAIAAPAAASGPPGIFTTNTGTVALMGNFAGHNSTGTFGFTAGYPSWVPTTAIDELSGTISPSVAVDNALRSLGAARCVLWARNFNVLVTGANPTPQTLNIGYQVGPEVSTLPALSFSIPNMYIAQLQAPSSGLGNITVQLKSIAGTVHCFRSNGASITMNNTVSYKAVRRDTKGWLAQTGYGVPPPPGIISGTVTDNNSPANPIANATVEVCTSGNWCVPTTTAANGTYSMSVPPGPYYVAAIPPTSITNLDRGTSGSLTVASSTTSTGNVVLDVTQPLPPGVSMTYNTTQPTQGPPVENWEHPFTITAPGCPNGTATWQLQGPNTSTAQIQTLTGPMTETPTGSGNYTGTIPAVYPMHGPMVITLTINCPDGSTQTITFPIYIDPSGTVVDQNGVPISGARVTLYKGPSLTGPWTAVPSGDTAIMSPSNTANPSLTGSVGQYGWDVVAGDYRLKATAPGCTADTSPGLPVAPPQTGITLTLTCKDGAGPGQALPHR